MDDRGSIFRTEAVEHRLHRSRRGDVLRVAPPWTTWAFYILLVIFAAGILVASTLRIDRFVAGVTAVDDQKRVVVHLPPGSVSAIAVGQEVDLGTVKAEVVSFDEAVVVTSARGGAAVAVEARILVGSDPVIIALVPGMRALFGDDDA